ncbi:hypothetical protein ACW2QC_03655 [Virgibacillus sp. FSP13]
MKRILLLVTTLFTTALLLMACSDDAEQSENSNTDMNQATQNQDNAEQNDSPDNKGDKLESTSESVEPDTDSSNETTSKENNGSNNQSNDDESNALSNYSSDEIEFARVWLQLGANQAIEKLYAKHISAGEPLNPDDETSTDYPEDVVQLSGARLVDGVVTYSSNGDGTINIYKVPKRWDGKNPAGEDTYKRITENTKKVSIAPGDDEKVEELIKILEID